MIPITLPAQPLQLPRRLPHQLLIPQPKPQHVPPLLPFIMKAAPRVQHRKIVENHHVPLLQLDLHLVLLRRKKHGIQCLGLYLGHGRDVGVVRAKVGAGEGTAGELKRGALALEIKEERTGVVLALPELVKDPVVFDEGVDNVRAGGGELVVDLG